MERQSVLILCNGYSQPLYSGISKALEEVNIDAMVFTQLDEFETYVSDSGAVQRTYAAIVENGLEVRNQRNYTPDIIRALRMQYQLKAPIFISTYDKKKTFQPNNNKFAFLKDSYYHRLLRMPLTDPDWKNDFLDLEPMTDLRLKDVQITLFNSEGLVGEMLHELKNELISCDGSDDVIRGLINKYFARIIQIDHIDNDELETIKSNVFNKINDVVKKGQLHKLANMIDAFKDDIIHLLPSKDSIANQHKKERKKWKLIYLEDNEVIREEFKNKLDGVGIDCMDFSNGKEAFEVLRGDEGKNKIILVVADIRIYEPSEIQHWDEEWSDYQGYDLFEKANKELKGAVMGFVALTSGRARLIKLMKDERLNIHRYLKQHVWGSDEELGYFLDAISALGDKLYFKSRCRPKSTPWIKANTRFFQPLSYFYRDHLQQIDYAEAEEEINVQAKRIISLCRKRNLDKEEFSFMGTIKQKGEKNLERFREMILVGRRVALGLYYLETQDTEEIYRLMVVPDSGEEVSRSARKMLFNTTLGLSFKKDLPAFQQIRDKQYLSSGLLEEEVRFLHEDVKVLDYNELMMHKDATHDLQELIFLLEDTSYSIRKLGVNAIGEKEKNILDTNFSKINNIKKGLDEFRKISKIVSMLPGDAKKIIKRQLDFSCSEEINSRNIKKEINHIIEGGF